MSGGDHRGDYLLKLPSLTNAKQNAVSPSEFLEFADSYTESDDFPFLRRNDGARTIDADSHLPLWTYFHAHCPALQINVPIPLHPKLNETPFYCQMSYLLRACRPFTPVDDLEALTETDLNESYISGGKRVRDIRRALGGGRSVLVQQCTTRLSGVPLNVTEEGFSRLTVNPKSSLDAQDLVHWPGMVSTTMSEFWEHRSNPLNILNLLDLNCHLDAGRSAWMTNLYDDAPARRRVESELPFAVADLNRFPQWMLCGHSFAHTFLHHDAAGLSTYATVDSGRNLWFVLRWVVEEVTPELWYHRWRCLSTHDYLALEYRVRPPWIREQGARATINPIQYEGVCAEWEVNRVAQWECVDLTEGTMLIMPPEQPHIVFKPVMSVASGGHGLLWNALPLTEVGCRMDNVSPLISNDVHASMPLIHCAMALSLPEDPQDALDSGKTRKELEALVRLVLAYTLYRQARQGLDEGESPDQRYNKIDAPKLDRQAHTILEIYQNFLETEIPVSTGAANVTAADFSWATFRPLI